jgi:hypothetical protein
MLSEEYLKLLEARPRRIEMAGKAKYFHFNLTYYPGGGQATVCLLPLSGRAISGISFCSPEDNFSRAEGRYAALERALDGTHFSCHLVPDCKMDNARFVVQDTIQEIYRVENPNSKSWHPWMGPGRASDIEIRGRKRNG